MFCAIGAPLTWLFDIRNVGRLTIEKVNVAALPWFGALKLWRASVDEHKLAERLIANLFAW